MISKLAASSELVFYSSSGPTALGSPIATFRNQQIPYGFYVGLMHDKTYQTHTKNIKVISNNRRAELKTTRAGIY